MFRISSGIYPPRVTVFTDPNEYNSWLNSKGLETDSLKSCWAVTAVHEGEHKSYFTMYLDPKADQYTISHECIHLAWFILDYCGIEVNSDNHEALTYLHDYLFKKIHTKFTII